MEEEKTMPIAIIGMGCRFPGSCSTPERLWELCATAKSAWSEIPENRFKQEAFYHPRADNMGTFNAKGGHFLDEDISAWDASFFSFTADMAKSMDPQLRLLLETVFEALESAGLPLEKVAGSDTSVFAGTCFIDYHDILMKDPESLPRYFLTGNMMTFNANRVSHFFDLRGPSVSVDTACSTALSALHLACQTLRNGEAKMGIVGGANLLLHPSTFVGLSNLGLTGPDGKSYSFDSRAGGYGRGDGIASLIIKPLVDALRDGDPIRAVIRETAINQNGKTPTITSPSSNAQEELISASYNRAGLNPLDTAYVEAHGTGTLAGDTMEMTAVSEVLASHRPPNNPLRVGSIKANLGHLEAASGLAAVIKAVKMVELGQVPPQALLKDLNPRIDFNGLNLKIPRVLESWPEGQMKRVSISNFGAGGANAHVILDSADPWLAIRQKEAEPRVNSISHETTNRYVFSLSAKDRWSLRSNMNALAEYFTEFPSRWRLQDVAHTLNDRRSKFSWKCAFTASSIDELRTILGQSDTPVVQTNSSPRLGFVYTGQGAQWFAMGRQLFDRYPVYAASLQQSEAVTRKLGASWSLSEELIKDQESSRVNEPELSFPLTVAIQIALTQLLHSWGIQPTATTGHSSGEIPAAYAAGALSLEQAITIAYIRGHLTSRFIQEDELQGGMIAVGIGEAECLEMLQSIKSGMLSIACVNSPMSVTVSGDLEAILEYEALCQEQGIFNRQLKVKAAYHSFHMQRIAFAYLLELEKHIQIPTRTLSNVIFSSPVTGKVVKSTSELGARHWVQNMVQCVLFNDCLQNMILPEKETVTGSVDILIEIGPHGALGGPIRQILSLPQFHSQGIKYISCLTRDQDAVKTMQETAVVLYSNNGPVSLQSVNFPDTPCNGQVIHDLPTYRWNHSKKYWTDCLQIQEFCQRQFSRDDILGIRVPGLNPDSPTWHNIIRTADLPWLVEHTLETDILFPAAGFITMVVEAMRQVVNADPETTGGFLLSDIQISNAMVIPHTSAGLAVQLSLCRTNCQELTADRNTFDFSIYSQQSVSEWTKHCCGRVTPARESMVPKREPARCNGTDLSPLDREEYYKYLSKVGPTFGNSFQNVVSVAAGDMYASAIIQIPEVSSMMPSPHVSNSWVHPTTLDAVLHSTYAAVPKSRMMQLGQSIPTKLQSILISSSIQLPSNHQFEAEVQVLQVDSQGFTVRVSVFDTDSIDGPPICYIDNLHFRSLGVSAQEKEIAPIGPRFFHTLWKPDVSNISTSELESHVMRIPHDDKESSQSVQESLDLVAPVIRMIPQGTIYKDFTAIAKDAETAKGAPIVTGLCIDNAHYSSTESNICLDGFSQSLDQLTEFLTLFAHKYPRARVLQLGGHDEQYTLSVLQGLSQEIPQLTVESLVIARNEGISSPVSSEESLQDYDGRLVYAQLDICKDPLAQGFERSSFDLIIACLASDWVQKIEMALRHCRILLKPRGSLLALETNVPLQSSDLLPHSSLTRTSELNKFDAQKWSRILIESNFSGLDAVIPNSRDDDQSTHILILSTATDPCEAEIIECSPIFIVHSLSSDPIIDEWLQNLASLISSGSPAPLSVQRLEEIASDQACELCIFLDIEQPVLGALDEYRFNALKHIINSASMILWVSRGSTMDGLDPEQGLHSGLLRTLRLENEDRKYISLDIDPQRELWSTTTTSVIRDMCKRITRASEKGETEFEFAERQGQTYVPRLVSSYEAATHYHALTETPSPDMAKFPNFMGPQTQLIARLRGRLDSLTFVEVDENQKVVQLNDEDSLEIQPLAFGLGHQDVSHAMGQSQRSRGMGFECAGIITKVGSAATNGFKIGDSVFALLPSPCISNTVRLHWTNAALMPSEMSYETAASIPMAFVTAYYGLVDVARLEPKEWILIQCEEDDIRQAAIVIAQQRKAAILVVVHSDKEKDHLVQTHGLPQGQVLVLAVSSNTLQTWILEQTMGQGVDVALNSFGGALLQESFDCLARYGRFVDIGQSDAQQSHLLKMNSFTKGASFCAFDICQLLADRSELLSRSFQEVVKLVQQERIEIKTPIQIYNLNDIQTAFKTLHSGNNIGKTVVCVNNDGTVPIMKTPRKFQLSTNATYVIVGGLSGIGRKIAIWMVERGVKHIILLSRNAEANDNADLVAAFKNSGTLHAIRNCDISHLDQLRSVLTDCSASWPPIKGIVQAAGVLQNSVFNNMSYQQWKDATEPKVTGTKNLVSLLPTSTALDFFVILSSLTGVLGSLGQANYAAAGTYQDSIARQLHSQGIPAVSINLGSVLETGMAVRTDALARLERAGYHAHSIPELLSILESVISCHPPNSQIVPSIAPWTHDEELPWRREARFDATRVKGEGSGSADNVDRLSGSIQSPKALLAAARNADEVFEVILAALKARIAFIFMIHADDINIHKSLLDYGVDSLVAVELRNWLTANVLPDISVFDITQSQTLLHFAQKIKDKIQARGG